MSLSSMQLSMTVGGVEYVTGTGTAQSGAAPLIGAVNVVTAASGQTAFLLPTGYPIGSPLFIINTSAVAGVIFPASGGTINGGSANASKALSANDTSTYIQYAANQWGSALGA